MLFNSPVFIVFLLVVVPVYALLKKATRKKYWILAASYVFYGYWDWRFCFLLLFSTVLDYWLGLLIHRSADDRQRKRLLVISLVANLSLLGFFKYFNFFVDSFSGLAGAHVDFLHMNIILPVGISFYTFQSLSYTFDVYRNRMQPARSLLDYALFVSFFPQLVAGPIEKAIDLLPQVQDCKNPTSRQVEQGLALITVGMFKKVLIGDTIAKYVDHIFADPSYYTSGELLCALILFSIQIYADFSGYSMIAKGCGKLLGVTLVDNFMQPYLASNITDFWRRWHISLSSWLRDYVYIWWLGGNRRGQVRTYINLIVTMLLGGLWHGANWTFVVWGGIHGIALALHKWFLKGSKLTTTFVYSGTASIFTFVCNALITYIIVLFAWLFFRAPDLASAISILQQIVEWTPSELMGEFLAVTATYAVVVLMMDIVEYKTNRQDYLMLMSTAPRWGLMLTCWVVVITFMLTIGKPNPFIYFQF